MTEYSAQAQRRLGCSPDIAFSTWIEPAILPQWLAPPPYEMTRADVDARAGGAYRHDVAGPEPMPHVVTGQFLELEPGKALRFDWVYRGPNPAPRPEPTVVQVSFAPDGADGSLVTLEHSALRDEREQAHYAEGWRDCFDRLERLYPVASS